GTDMWPWTSSRVVSKGVSGNISCKFEMFLRTDSNCDNLPSLLAKGLIVSNTLTSLLYVVATRFLMYLSAIFFTGVGAILLVFLIARLSMGGTVRYSLLR